MWKVDRIEGLRRGRSERNPLAENDKPAILSSPALALQAEAFGLSAGEAPSRVAGFRTARDCWVGGSH